eukprot:s777_g28.t1
MNLTLHSIGAPPKQSKLVPATTALQEIQSHDEDMQKSFSEQVCQRLIDSLGTLPLKIPKSGSGNGKTTEAGASPQHWMRKLCARQELKGVRVARIILGIAASTFGTEEVFREEATASPARDRP